MHGDSVNTYNLRKQIETYGDNASVPVLAGGIRAILTRLDRLEDLVPKLRSERHRYLTAAVLLRKSLSANEGECKPGCTCALDETAWLDEVRR